MCINSNKMFMVQFCTQIYIIIYISNVETATQCVKQWLDMQAYTAEGKCYLVIDWVPETQWARKLKKSLGKKTCEIK